MALGLPREGRIGQRQGRGSSGGAPVVVVEAAAAASSAGEETLFAGGKVGLGSDEIAGEVEVVEEEGSASSRQTSRTARTIFFS